MRRTLLAGALALLFAGQAEAAQRACHGAASGVAGDVRVVLFVDDGKVTAGLWRWIPLPDDGSSFGARIVIERRYTDLENGAVGDVQLVQVVNVARLDPPKVDQAVVAISTDSAGPVVKPWRMYAEAAATLRAGGIPKGMPTDGRAANFVGLIPFGRQDAGASELIRSLNSAKSVTTRVSDAQGRVVISQASFQLGHRPIAESLGREARRLARAAAAKPFEQCEPMNVGGVAARPSGGG